MAAMRRKRNREVLLRTSHKSTTNRRVKRYRNRFLRVFRSFSFIRTLFKNLRGGIIFISVVVAMALFVVFALFSPYFGIKKITIQRDNPQFDIERIEQSLSDYYGENLLFVNTNTVKELLQTNFPEFKSIEISEKWPSEMILKIEIAKPAVVLFHTDTASYVYGSDTGIVLPGEVNSPDLLQIDVYQHPSILDVYTRILQPDEYQKIIEGKTFLEENLGLPIKKIDYYYAAQEIHFVSRGDMKIWVDIDQDLMPQLLKLVYSREEIKLDTDKFKHIDLRIPNQLFWQPI